MRKLIVIIVSFIWSMCICSQIRSNVGSTHILYGQNDSSDSYTASDYIQDGLVALWDGIENIGFLSHDDSSRVWVDLVGGMEIPTVMPSLSWGNDALVREGVDGLTYDTGIDFSDPLSERTFEFVISYDADYVDTSANYFVARLNGLGTWLCFWNRMRFGIALYAGGGIKETIFEQPSFRGSVALVGSGDPYIINPSQRHFAYYYQNGIYLGNGAFGGNGEASTKIELFAAGRNWPSPNTIKVHCIRIYNRALTADDVYQNWCVDKERFGL